LAQAFAEKAAIEKALVSGVKVGPVKQGDPIGLVGNTGYPGCSTGKHLHFEVQRNNSWTDPAPFLQNKSVRDEQNPGGNMVAIGSGNWPWLIADTIRLTQFYGSTPYSWRYVYSGGVHTGLDMISTSNDVISAPADGTLYKSSQICGSDSTINIIYIDHGEGLISFYLHVQ
jgi:murein DD-endopeptidase MepM/ murein hydrolase activator NlpD